MKKILATLTLVVAGASAFAQGTVNFANNAATQVRFAPTGTAWSGATNVTANLGSVELLYAELGTAMTPYAAGTLTTWLQQNPGWETSDTSIRAINPAGRFNAGVQTLATAAAGGVVQAIVIGWFTPSGAVGTFDAAIAAASTGMAYVGFSQTFNIDTANPSALPTPETPTLLTSTTFGSLVLTPVPEPSTFALAGLGAAALLIFRRRK